MIKKILILWVFTLVIACRKEVPIINNSNIEESSIDNNFIENLKNITHSVTINYIDVGENLIIAVDYPAKNNDQVALLAAAAKAYAQLAFQQSFVQSLFLFYTKGSDEVQLRHYIKIEQADWAAASLSDNPFDIYNLASHYYIGPRITGNLSFNYNGQDVFLPVQKGGRPSLSN